jgi:hypothetical protein
MREEVLERGHVRLELGRKLTQEAVGVSKRRLFHLATSRASNGLRELRALVDERDGR